MFQLLFLKYFRLVFILLCIAVLCFNTDPNVLIAGEIESVNIENAEFKSSDKELKVEVKIKSSGEDQERTVKLFDEKTDELLGEKGSKDETIKFKFTNIFGSNVPCRVVAKVEGFSDMIEKDVKNAPDNCSNGSGGIVADGDSDDGDSDDGDGGDGGGNIETDNLVALHDKSSPQYDKNCTACHLDILNEKSLDSSIETAHVSMLSKTPGEKDNEKCGWCHRTVDLIGGSAGNLRKQVKADLCVMCHGDDGFGEAEPYYQTSITSGAKLYELACAFCHKDLANSEVKGEDAQEIREKIVEDEGGMKPLEELSPSQIQVIADVLAQ